MWFVLAFLSSLIFSFYGIVSTMLSVKSKDPVVLSITFNIVCGIISFCIALFEPHVSGLFPTYGYFLIALGILTYTVFSRFEFQNAKANATSVRSLFHPITPVVATILAVIFYNEQVTLSKVIGMAILIIANLIVTINFKKEGTVTAQGFKYILLTYIPLGIAWSIDKHLGSLLPVSFYIGLTYLFPALINMVLLKVKMSDIYEEVVNSKGKVFILSILQVVGYYLFVYALTLGDGSRVSFVQSIQNILTIILGIVLLGEREKVGVKLFAGVVLLIGLVFLTR